MKYKLSKKLVFILSIALTNAALADEIFVPIMVGDITIFIPYNPHNLPEINTILYEYDALGRLVEVKQGTENTTYSYDDADNRTSKTTQEQ